VIGKDTCISDTGVQENGDLQRVRNRPQGDSRTALDRHDLQNASIALSATLG